MSAASTRREFLRLGLGLTAIPLLAACGAPAAAPPAAVTAAPPAQPVATVAPTVAASTPLSSTATQGAALFPNPQPPAPNSNPPKYGGTFVAPTYGDPLFGGDTMFGALSVTFTATHPVNGDVSLVRHARDH